jgi:type II secretory ATPase GspE/PulE/Tfp pilus assembly ATPase PilB-like protein
LAGLGHLSFQNILVFAVVATLASLGLFYLRPDAVVPVLGVLGALSVLPLALQFLRDKAGALKRGTMGAAVYTAHNPARIRATLEAYEADARPDVPGLVDYVLQQAALHQASDVHLVPYRDFMQVRFRIDGILTDVAQLSPRLKELTTNRLKVMSRVVTYVHDRPQDGRIDLDVGPRKVDLRAAFMPTLHGNRVVLRVLDAGDTTASLSKLGLTTAQLAQVQDLVFRPQGMVVLNGPAGSGKTTTIYATLRAILDHSEKGASIYTLEDPIELDLLNINQTQIEEGQGFTFAHGLRNMLRQDPDVIMVGEIRDLDTARIAVQAGMTGHLLITTVHAKQAAGVFVRLTEIGVDPHSTASAMSGVIAQRLLRLLCLQCRQPAPATPGQEAKLGRSLGQGAFHVAVGCPSCQNKGYAGRRGVFEILLVDEAIRELIASRTSSDRIYRAAVENGMTTLVEGGIRLARDGETSLEEVLRVLPPEQRGA